MLLVSVSDEYDEKTDSGLSKIAQVEELPRQQHDAATRAIGDVPGV